MNTLIAISCLLAVASANPTLYTPLAATYANAAVLPAATSYQAVNQVHNQPIATTYTAVQPAIHTYAVPAIHHQTYAVPAIHHQAYTVPAVQTYSAIAAPSVVSTVEKTQIHHTSHDVVPAVAHLAAVPEVYTAATRFAAGIVPVAHEQVIATSASNVPAETPEVVAARVAHFAEHAALKSRARRDLAAVLPYTAATTTAAYPWAHHGVVAHAPLATRAIYPGYGYTTAASAYGPSLYGYGYGYRPAAYSLY